MLKIMDINYEDRKIAEFDNINYNKKDRIMIVWHPDSENRVKSYRIKYINIIEKVEKALQSSLY